MSLLVIQLPPRERLGTRTSGTEGAPAVRLPASWPYLLSPDAQQPGPLRHAPVALLPKADTVVLVLAATDVSWHRVLIPKAAAARLPAALAGVLEERLLDDEAAVHLALAPGAVGGQEGWVAATHGPRLTAALAALEAGGLTVNRVACLAAPPGPQWRGHFSSPRHAADAAEEAADQAADQSAMRAAPGERSPAGAEPVLCLSRDDGVWVLPLAEQPAAGLAGALRASLAESPAAGATSASAPPATARWTTTPATALAAERFLGRPVPLQTEAEHLLEAALGLGAPGASGAVLNLRQFDLSVRHRGLRAVGDVGKRLLSTEWRLVRWGLLALLGLQLVGLNAYAWQQRQALQAKRTAVVDILRSAHPGVRTVLDAPAQMAGETDRLRAAAGQPGGADLEVALAAAAAVWPEGKGPVATLRYENGRLTLAAAGWQEAEVTTLRERLRAGGWGVEYSDARLVLSRLRTGAS